MLDKVSQTKELAQTSSQVSLERVYQTPKGSRSDEWRIQREHVEEGRHRKFLPPIWRQGLFGISCWAAHWLLFLGGLYPWGKRNALRLGLRELEVFHPDVPERFEGYTILQISDMHFDTLPGVAKGIAATVQDLDVDLCCFTGDFQGDEIHDMDPALEGMKEILPWVKATDGITAILGNHDSLKLLKPLEDMGLEFLVNETVRVSRCEDSIEITGVDDVHNYYTPDAPDAMQASGDGFKLALVHSPGLEAVASDAGYSLYLCGHTHGGQIALPGQKPVVMGSKGNHDKSHGSWSENGMLGYTTRGVGVSILPVRFNAPPEIALITLRHGEAPAVVDRGLSPV